MGIFGGVANWEALIGELGALAIVLPPQATVACPLGFNSDLVPGLKPWLSFCELMPHAYPGLFDCV